MKTNPIEKEETISSTVASSSNAKDEYFELLKKLHEGMIKL